MVTKMVANWRVYMLYYIFKLGVWGQDCWSAVAKKAEITKRSHCHCFSDFEGTLDFFFYFTWPHIKQTLNIKWTNSSVDTSIKRAPEKVLYVSVT